MVYLPGRSRGARIVGLSTLTILALCAAILLVEGVTEESLRRLLRVTARTSLALFLAAFTASSLREFWPSAPTRWLLANRRFFGISFAISHLVHAAAIAGQAFYTRGRSLEGRAADLIGGGVVYLLILFMLATSFDRPAAQVGARVWTFMHTLGAYSVWTVFTLGVVIRAAQSPGHALALALLVAALALRVARRVRSRRRAGPRAGGA